MAKLSMRLEGLSLDRVLNMDRVEATIKEELRRQRVERFRTEGESDGSGMGWPKHRFDPSRSVLTDTGKLRDMTEFTTQRRHLGLTIEMRVQAGLELVSNVHQFGVDHDIVPKSAKALFIPTSGRGRKSFLTISLGQSEPGGSTVEIPQHVEGQPAHGARKRHGIKGNRRGLSPEVVSLKRKKKIKTGKRAGEFTKGGDFVLVSAIRATPEKDGFAIQPRPHFRVTDKNAADLKDAIVDALTGR